MIALLAIVSATALASCVNANTEDPMDGGIAVGNGTAASPSNKTEITTRGETETNPETDFETDPETNPETDSETNPETDSEAETKLILDVETAPETETEPTPEPPTPSIIAPQKKIPVSLVSQSDIPGYLKVPYMTSDGRKEFTFSMIPTDTDSNELVDVFEIGMSENVEFNIQIYLSVDSRGNRDFMCLREGTYIVMNEDGTENRVVFMEGYQINFLSKKIHVTSTYDKRYYYISKGGSASLSYVEDDEDDKQYVLRINEFNNEVAFKHVKELIYSWNKNTEAEVTLLYGYVDGVETFNTPVESIPEYPFSLFRQYGCLE